MLPRTRDRIALLESELAERDANWLDSKVSRRVLVQVNAERGEPDSIEGVLSLVCPDGVVLVNAVYLDAEARKVPMAGEVWLPRPKVRIVQTLPTVEAEA